MLALVLSHALAAAVAPWLVRRVGRWTFLLLALVPTATVVWALSHTATVLDGGRIDQHVEWVPGVGLDLTLSMAALQWLLVLVVAGVGALVLTYCTWYFRSDSAHLAPFAGNLTAFMGAMLGLVVSDNLLLLFVFWELTTIFSFLLIGFDPGKRASRLAALQALVVTTLGGLAMLVGFLLLGSQSGSYLVSEIVADPPRGTAVTVAVLLILLGALSKSAQVPLHFWLPGAMAAPTPVSAYLHAASMVKAGVFLVALLAPGFARVPGWHLVLLTLGSLTMLLGGWRALRQIDIKLLLAYGTVSQLGFLMVVLSDRQPHRRAGRAGAAAGPRAVQGHALPRASASSTPSPAPATCTSCPGSAAGSRSSPSRPRWPAPRWPGLPPLLGFVAKETMWTALLELAHGDVAGLPPLAGWAVLVGAAARLVASPRATPLRFLWGAFADKPGVAPTPVRAAAPRRSPPRPLVLALLGLGLGFAGHALTTALAPYADRLPAGPHEEYLALWHGLGAAAAALRGHPGRGLRRCSRSRDAVVPAPGRAPHPPISAEQTYRVDHARWSTARAIEVTGLVQRGSVPAYLDRHPRRRARRCRAPRWSMALVDGPSVRLVAWDRAAQPVVGAGDAGRRDHDGALAAPAARGDPGRRHRLRLRAALPAARRPRHRDDPGAGRDRGARRLRAGAAPAAGVLHRPARCAALRYGRMALAAGVGVAVAGFVLRGRHRADRRADLGARSPRPAYDFGYGRNVVNVTLVDIRAWDTFGEISVLVVAATGVASLIFLDSRSSGIRRVFDIPYPEGVQQAGPPARGPAGSGCPGPRTLSPDRRSIVFEVVTRLLFPTIVVFSVYLLVAGHNLPGGGFAAGMVTGLALMVRYLAGGRYELDEAAPVDAGVLIGTGLFVAALSGLGPVAFGGAVLQTADVYVPIAAARRAAPGLLGRLRHRRLPRRRRPGPRPAAHLRLAPRPPDPAGRARERRRRPRGGESA